MDKSLLRSAILDKINAEIENQTRAALMAREEATHEQSKPENKYDMRAQEAAYLAEGQARLAAELKEALALYANLPVSPWPLDAPAGIGAVVTLEAEKRPVYYFIGPRGGGTDVMVEGKEVTVVTPASPLGRQLLGVKLGATVMLPGRPRPIAHQVIAIA
jgi:transcription elongation GreA/GreB family factor